MADNFFEACLKRAPVVAGPIADFTDSPFRRVLRSFSNCLVYTEMISGHGLSQRNESSLKYAFFKNEERPIVHQIFGSLPERMAEAARVLASNGAEAIDINMGCPQHRLARHGEGAALMNDFEKAAAIVSKVKDVTGLPVSVKIRAGYDYASVIAGKSAQKIAPVLENAGADMIVVHPRLKIQMFSGLPDHSVTLAVRKAVDIPVVANGNLDNVLLAKKVWQEMRDVSESKGLGKAAAELWSREASEVIRYCRRIQRESLPPNLQPEKREFLQQARLYLPEIRKIHSTTLKICF
ncbi:MAG: tRNA-dihydrouridine synthase family protein [Thermoplasmata archaeon]